MKEYVQKVFDRKSDSNEIIHKTTNYGQFKFIIGNRTISPRPDLKKSIKDAGLIHPIIVDYDYNVLDGQHRLKCCEELGIPVDFIVRNVDAEAVVTLNTHQKKWKRDDYFERYAALGYPQYLKFRQLQNKYGLSPMHTELALFGYRPALKDVSLGLLKVTEEHESRMAYKMLLINDLLEISGGMFRRKLLQNRMFTALNKLIADKNYQHERFLKILSDRVAIHQFKVLSKIEDNFISLCEFHDKGLRSGRIMPEKEG